MLFIFADLLPCQQDLKKSLTKCLGILVSPIEKGRGWHHITPGPQSGRANPPRKSRAPEPIALSADNETQVPGFKLYGLPDDNAERTARQFVSA